MNTNVEQLPECRANLRVEVPAETVEAERQKVVGKIARQVRIPGFRPGKAPRSVVESRFTKQIEDELGDLLVREGCRAGIDSENLDVLSIDKIEETSFNVDGTFSFTASITTRPSFELPEYKGVEVKVPRIEVSDADVDKAIESYRERLADFSDIEDRPVELGDIAVLDYQGTVDGKFVGEVFPQANAYLAQNHDYWMKVDPKVFLPGFAEQIVGATIGEERAVRITLPDDFPIREAAGREVEYAVTVKGIKHQELPEVDDDFAAKVEPGKTLEELVEGIRERIRAEREQRVEDLKIEQILQKLTGEIDFELPADIVKHETQAQVDELVQRGQKAGMEDDQIVERQKEIIDVAGARARGNVKTSFVLHEIAKAEKIRVADNELLERIQLLAHQYRTPPKKFIKQLQKENSIGRIREGMLIRKVLDFLRENAAVEEVDPPAEDAEAGLPAS